MISVQPIPVPLTYDFRSLVFNRPRSDCFWPEDKLDGTFHLGGYADEIQKGVCSFAPLSGRYENAFFLYGLAVLEASRGLGLGGLLLLAGEDRVREQGIPQIWCHARLSAQGFYQKYGWEADGTPAEATDGTLRIPMVKDLTKPYGCKAHPTQ